MVVVVDRRWSSLAVVVIIVMGAGGGWRWELFSPGDMASTMVGGRWLSSLTVGSGFHLDPLASVTWHLRPVRFVVVSEGGWDGTGYLPGYPFVIVAIDSRHGCWLAMGSSGGGWRKSW